MTYEAADDEQPAPYYLGYENSVKWKSELARVGGETTAVDPCNFYDYEDAVSYEVAVAQAHKRARQHKTTVGVYQRYGIYSFPVTDWPYVVWRWDDEDRIADVDSHGTVIRLD